MLRGLTLSVPEGSRVAVLGGNGAGKTTLFRLLQGLQEPDGGTLRCPPPHTVLLCTQEPQLFGNASVPYNVAYGCMSSQKTVRSTSWTSWTAFGPHAEAAAAMMGITHLVRAEVSTLSGGERQRIGLARVLAAVLEQPQRLKLLLLDEHDSALDCKGKEAAGRVVERIRELSACTTITITHVATGTYDHAMVLKDGEIACQGGWREVAKEFFHSKQG